MEVNFLKIIEKSLIDSLYRRSKNPCGSLWLFGFCLRFARKTFGWFFCKEFNMLLGVDFIDFFIVDRDTSIWKKLMYFGEFLNGGFSKIIQIVRFPGTPSQDTSFFHGIPKGKCTSSQTILHPLWYYIP